jgi:hypothetical protein
MFVTKPSRCPDPVSGCKTMAARQPPKVAFYKACVSIMFALFFATALSEWTEVVVSR